MAPPVPVLKLTRVAKRFGGVVALKGIDWDVMPGEVHCLCGENGCGKSTLIKIVAGVHPPDPGGTIEIGGMLREGLTPHSAKMLGIQVIFQDLSLFPNLTVAENIAIDVVLHGLARPVRRKAMRDLAARLLERLGVMLPLEARLADLSIAERQVVAICRGLAAEAKLLFMDEPTASLTRTEVDALLRIVGRLKKDGIAVVFVSHRLDEVVEIADRVTVMRDGARVGTYRAGEVDELRIGELMTGLTLTHRVHARKVATREMLSVEGLGRDGEYDDVSFSISAGEILGLTGLLGAGRTELALTLFGMRRPDRGTIRIEGRPLPIRSNAAAIAAGIAYVPEDRLRLGLDLRQSIEDNLVLSVLDDLTGWLGLLSPRKKRAMAALWVEKLRIKIPGLGFPVSSLSGGNQQRIVLGKWLATRPKVLILDSPTVGVDIGNKQAIYDLVHELAAEGVAVLMISDEISEVYYNCDAVLHMRAGRIADIFLPGRETEAEVEAAVHA